MVGWQHQCNGHELGQNPGDGRGQGSLGEGNGNSLQYSCLENPVDGRAWWAAVHEVSESDTTEATWHACIGEGNGDPLQYSCRANTRDRGAWWAAVYGVAQSRTRLSSNLAAAAAGKPGVLQPMGLQRARHYLATEQQQLYSFDLPVRSLNPKLKSQ